MVQDEGTGVGEEGGGRGKADQVRRSRKKQAGQARLEHRRAEKNHALKVFGVDGNNFERLQGYDDEWEQWPDEPEPAAPHGQGAGWNEHMASHDDAAYID